MIKGRHNMGRNPYGNCMKMIKLDSCRMGEVWLDE